jgi:hypothetical protein
LKRISNEALQKKKISKNEAVVGQASHVNKKAYRHDDDKKAKKTRKGRRIFWRKLSSFVFVMNSPWWMAGHSQPYAFLSFYGILALSLKLEVLLIYARLM